jgi:hypothetical protein
MCNHASISPCVLTRLIMAMLWGWLCAIPSGNAQSTLLVPPLSAPNLDIVRSGRVDQVLRLNDGRFLVGGVFDRLGNVERAGTARLFADGSVDSAFVVPSTANFAKAFAVDGLGRVYVMTGIRIVRLLESGAPDTSFNVITLATGTFNAMAISADQLFAAGSFSTVAGQPRINAAKFDLTGALDTTWSPNPDAEVSDLLAPGNGFVYLSGGFSNVGGAARAGLARVALTGNGAADTWAPTLLQTAGTPRVTAQGHNGTSLFISGDFSSVNGAARSRLAKLDLGGTGALDSAWIGALSRPATVLRVIGTSLYVGGIENGFRATASSGASSLVDTRLARFAISGTGVLDTTFSVVSDPTPNGPIVNSIEQADASGRIVIGGNFSRLTTANARLGLAALNTDGSLDALSAMPEALLAGTISAMDTDVDGSIFVSGNFVKVNGAERRSLFKLTPNRLVDALFRPADFEYQAAALRPGSAIYAADATTKQIRKLSTSSGDPIAGFAPLSYTQSILRMQTAGQHIYVMGSFLFTGITPSISNFGRISFAADSFDGTFRPSFNGTPSSASVDTGSNSLLLFGTFTSVNAVARSGLAKFDATTGAFDTLWNPQLVSPSTNNVSAALPDGSGGLYVAGSFTSINGNPCRAPARLFIAGTGNLDSAFACTRDNSVTAMTLADGALYGVDLFSILRYPISAGGNSDANWTAVLDNTSRILARSGNQLMIAGDFKTVSGVARKTIAALPLIERFFANGFEN